MPTRDHAPNGAPCWIDLMTSDVDRALAFYGEVFGWEASEPDARFGGYISITKGGARIAGVMAAQPGMGVADVWSVYLATDDAVKTLEVATANGATTIVDAMQVGEHGTMAVIVDPAGAALGVWQPDQHHGFGVLAEPNTPGWFELHTRGYDTAVAFYRTVFGWDTHVQRDSPEFRYTTLGEGPAAAAGIMDASGHLPEGVPSHWAVYFTVADVDATLTTIVDQGGSVVQPAEDTPYGRLAMAADPLGAQFRLVANMTTG